MYQIQMEAKQLKNQIVSDRRTLHQCPELGMYLPQTTAYVKKRLREMGIDPQDCGPSGITALIGNPGLGKTILLRGDMDALPTPEENDLSFNPHSPYSHLCGHDLHTAMLLGAAQILKNHEKDLNGAVKLMFQPGEEVGKGALSMLADGIMENPKVDAAVAIHVFPDLPTAHVGYIKGVTTAAMDAFSFQFQGKGGHSSQPQNCIDPLIMVSTLHLQLASLTSREVSPTETAVLTVGKMGGGSAVNIIPDTAELRCGLRTYNPEVRRHLCSRIPELAENTASSLRGSCTLLSKGGVPSVFSNPQLVDQLLPAIKEAVGPENVIELAFPATGSEDFSHVSLKVPAIFLRLGSATPGNNVSLHHPGILFHEDALPCGAAVYANCAIQYLKSSETEQ